MKELTKQQIITGCKIHGQNKVPCIKRPVYCVIVSEDNKCVFGSNWINDTSVKECPRAESPSGVDYHLCKEVCKQNSHAETDALTKATKLEVITYGASLYLTGHNYCCDNCIIAMRASGIKYVKCIDSNKEYILWVIKFV